MHRLLGVSMQIFLFALSVSGGLLTIRQSSNGPIEGKEETSSLGKKFYAFKGIPYAEAPISGRDPHTGDKVDRRFKAPVPLKRKWTENYKAFKYGDACIRAITIIPAKLRTSENCLFLNIYVPDGGAAKKTVLVWIHGGAFSEGESSDFFYGPDLLLGEDNIVVTLSYRLGIYGFLNLGFDEYTGNMGLKDQQLALKWIHDNIENFSGNKDEILLFGQSAGGASVNFQMLNEESRKYFNRAFSMSDTALNYYALSEKNHLKRMQDCTKIYDKRELVEYLKTTWTIVLSHCTKLTIEKTLPDIPWGPTIESPNTKGAFITEKPEQIYKSDKAPTMDAMFSFTSQEFIAFSVLSDNSKPLITADSNASPLELPFRGFNRSLHPEEYKQAVELLRVAYYTDTNDENAVHRSNIDLLSDSNYVYDILKTVALQVEANNKGFFTHKNTFLHRFSVDAGLNAFKRALLFLGNGTSHADDVCYIFHCHILDVFNSYDTYLHPKENEPDVTRDTITRMVKMITNFARTGNPSVQGDTPFKSSTSPNELFSQEIDNNPKTSVLTDITKQHHYDTWRDVEKIIQQGVQNNGSRLEAIFPGGTFSEGIFEKNGNWLAKKFNCC